MTTAPPWHPAAALSGASYSAVELFLQDDRVFLLEQRELPGAERYHTYTSASALAIAIKEMVVRGAPAIGIAAAYGMVLAAKSALPLDPGAYLERMAGAGAELDAARPTAVNLGWAVKRCLALATQHAALPGDVRWREMAALARKIHSDDVEACRAMGRIGGARLPDEGTVLTHCNAGALATGGYGTALGVIRGALAMGKKIRVLADETRPYLQGARLTAWELQRDGIAVEVICDSMAGALMKRGQIAAVIVGADRIAANGDVANKIGTYSVACLASLHKIPFYVAAPWSTVDLATPSGAEIPIEERGRDEVAKLAGASLIPDGVGVRHPAFDVTPAALITAIFTERGEHAPGDIAAAGAFRLDGAAGGTQSQRAAGAAEAAR